MAIKSYTPNAQVLTAAASVQGAAVADLTKRIITAAALVNPTAGAVAATVYMVPSGGAPGAGNALIYARTLAPGETYFCPELINQGLDAGGTVQALGAGLSFKHTAKDLTNG